MAFLSLRLYDTSGLAPRMNVLFWGPGDFPVSCSNRDTSWNAWSRHSGSFLSIRWNRFNHTSWVTAVTPTDRPKSVRNSCVIKVFGGVFMSSRCFLDCSVGVGVFVTGLSQISSFFSYSAILSLPLTNVKWHSHPWPVTVTSQPIILATNLITLIPSLTFTELRVVSMENFQWVWHASRERLPIGHLVPSPFLRHPYGPIVETRFLELVVSLLNFSPWKTLDTLSILFLIEMYVNCMSLIHVYSK